MPDPNQNNPQPNPVAAQPVVPPTISSGDSLPPLPPEFQKSSPEPTSSGAPVENAPPGFSPTITTPKKKFGGGRIVATILGVLLLIGGVGAGYVITQQPQIFRPKANPPLPQTVQSDTPEANAIAAYTQARRRGQNEEAAHTLANQAAINTFVAINVAPDANGNYGNTGYALDTSNNQVINTTTQTSVADSAAQTAEATNAVGDGGQCGPNTSNFCANGYTCQNDTCQGNPVTNTCGRNIDTGAPVCCTDSACGGGQKVCEGQNRLECVVNGIHCTIDVNGCTAGNPPAETTTTTSTVPACLNVKAYSSNWTALTDTELSKLAADTVVNFCVVGSNGTFDKAMFKINSTTEPETTTKGQGAAAAAFCQSYTIKAADIGTTVSIKAKIHDSTANSWVGETF